MLMNETFVVVDFFKFVLKQIFGGTIEDTLT